MILVLLINLEHLFHFIGSSGVIELFDCQIDNHYALSKYITQHFDLIILLFHIIELKLEIALSKWHPMVILTFIFRAIDHLFILLLGSMADLARSVIKALLIVRVVFDLLDHLKFK